MVGWLFPWRAVWRVGALCQNLRRAWGDLLRTCTNVATLRWAFRCALDDANSVRKWHDVQFGVLVKRSFGDSFRKIVPAAWSEQLLLGFISCAFFAGIVATGAFLYLIFCLSCGINRFVPPTLSPAAHLAAHCRLFLSCGPRVVRASGGSSSRACGSQY